MEAPPGVNIPKDHVFVLDKAIYGCKQSARAWSDELDSHLEKIGFSRTTAEPVPLDEKSKRKGVVRRHLR